MEVDELPPPTLPPAHPQPSRSAHWPSSRKGAAPTRGAHKEAKLRRTSPRAGGITAKDATTPKNTASKMARMGSVAGKPLVPVTERRSHGEKNAPRGVRDADGDKGDIAPDGGSAGREGRHFAVANVGNNGRIYLRPTVRPSQQRFPQPNFVFPVTPPGTTGLDALTYDRSKQEDGSELHTSQWTPTPLASPRSPGGHYFSDSQNPDVPTRHRRAVSDSTVQDASAANEADTGAFKIIISKPGEEKRPRTMEDLDPAATPVLDIQIPSWRIGTPQFTGRGTPLLRGSSYAPTEELRMSRTSALNLSQRDINLSSSRLPMGSRKPSALAVPQMRPWPAPAPSPGLSTPLAIRPMRSTYLSTHLVIEPAMFDYLTFKPDCDDRAIVRYSPSTGAVTAATPPRLVAEITSPSFLDYELISDFFLTFRAFMEPADLLRMLIARLRWAVAREDETGMIVRVRTFVALRHWILNYFLDDFVADYAMRVNFCNLLNDFVDELVQDDKARKVQVKILAELKKCWRRICAHYWDGPDFDDTLGPSVPIAPGGMAGVRDPRLDPAAGESDHDAAPQLRDSFLPIQNPDAGPTSFYIDVSRAGHIGDSVVVGDRPRTPDNPPDADLGFGPETPFSMNSVDVVSCSFPGKTMRGVHQQSSHPMATHPVAPSSVYNQTGPVATTPMALVGKRVRPALKHQRNNSHTDSLRDHDPEKAPTKSEEFLMTSPHAGSLVRGNFLPPAKGFVDVSPHTYSGEGQRQTTFFQAQPQPQSVIKEGAAPDAMSSYGMRKLIGSVRRALSTRGQWVSPTHGNFISIAPIGPRGATTNRLPGTAVVPFERSRQKGARPPVRIDLLGAEVAEDFKKAVREDAAADAEQFGLSRQPPNMVPREAAEVEYSAAHMESSTFDSLPQNRRPRRFSESGLTIGSKSIVIVDDTVPLEVSSIHGGVPTINSSVEAFGDTVLPQGADPTPPNTPPERFGGGTPRRSSHLLDAPLVTSSAQHDPLPPFVPDLATLGMTSARPSEDLPRPSLSFLHGGSRHPPISSALYRIHRRNKSSRTQRSLDSVMHQRRASFSSGFAPPSTIRSFDATTYSEGSEIGSSESKAAAPEPLRVLRRRPGGDLRAATNVAELDPVRLNRSRSVGSLTAYSESIQSSYLQSARESHLPDQVPVMSDDFTERPDAFSVGQLAKAGPKRDLSLFSTHSSKPVMRPSFELEAQKLAQIPDDDADDGGVEAALLKLEGRFSQHSAPRLSMDMRNQVAVHEEEVDPETIGVAISDPVMEGHDKEDHRHMHLDSEVLVVELDSQEEQDAAGDHLDLPQRPITDMQSFLSEESRDSYSSIPLLDRGLTDEGRSKRATREWADKSILQDSDDDTSQFELELPRATPSENSAHISFDFIHKTDSLEKIKPGETAPSENEQSFLDDDSVNGSDLSSEISVDGPGTGIFGLADAFAPKPTLPAHALGEPSSVPHANPPSPPTPKARAFHALPKTSQIPELHEDMLWSNGPLPMTPRTTPPAPYVQAMGSLNDPTGTTEALRGAPNPKDDSASRYSVHLPFILAFESEILAQQLTLIEKDALNEIDWKELIEMNWKNSASNDFRSWVHFLRNADARGVEVVIARFNIMVKWAISEIVLTQDIEERARCIIKYIHIAAHCRHYRNFATVAQLTIALSSTEVARLVRTWQMVPANDLKVLRELETLVTPTRNFYNLRAEMETGSDAGCIPFVVIYTHDLLYNAQRPSEIASSPTTAPLVNFERCRVGAAVVKTLLRLLEASSRYSFQPIEGVTERCLWMGALSDDEIRRHSESLE